jgi:integrase
VDWLSWPEVHAVLGAIPEFRLRLAAAWLFYTGCRVGEAVAARQREVRRPSPDGFYLWSIPETKTNQPRSVRLPPALDYYIEQSRVMNNPQANWPLLWDCQGRGFARTEDPTCPISPRTINAALDMARRRGGLAIRVTAHVARHTYCTNWIADSGSDENSMAKLSIQVGTSVTVLRRTYVHVQYDEASWELLRTFGQQ